MMTAQNAINGCFYTIVNPHEKPFSWDEYKSRSDRNDKNQISFVVDSSDFVHAFRDWLRVKEYAQEEGFDEPSEVAINNSWDVLMEMCHIFYMRYEVYPMASGSIVVDAPNGKGSSVLFLCESNGAISCLINIKGKKHRSKRNLQIKDLNDSFIVNAMLELNVTK